MGDRARVENSLDTNLSAVTAAKKTENHKSFYLLVVLPVVVILCFGVKSVSWSDMTWFETLTVGYATVGMFCVCPFWFLGMHWNERRDARENHARLRVIKDAGANKASQTESSDFSRNDTISKQVTTNTCSKRIKAKIKRMQFERAKDRQRYEELTHKHAKTVGNKKRPNENAVYKSPLSVEEMKERKSFIASDGDDFQMCRPCSEEVMYYITNVVFDCIFKLNVIIDVFYLEIKVFFSVRKAVRWNDR